MFQGTDERMTKERMALSPSTMKLFSPTERKESSLSFHIWISEDEYDYLPPPASTVVFSFEFIVDGHIPDFFFELRLSPLLYHEHPCHVS